MKPLHFLCVIPLALTGFVLAETRPREVDESLLQLRADLPLIEALVEGAIQIAGEEEPDRRAGHCQKLAQRFAEEIRDAAARKDRGRATELSQHLKDLLMRGMADNISSGKTQAQDSQRYKDLQNFAQQFIEPVETQLKKIADEDPSMKNAHQAVEQGRTEFQNAVEGKGKTKQPKTKDKGPPHGKGKKKGQNNQLNNR